MLYVTVQSVNVMVEEMASAAPPELTAELLDNSELKSCSVEETIDNAPPEPLPETVLLVN